MEKELTLFEKILLHGDQKFYPLYIYKTKHELNLLKIRFFVLAAVFIAVFAASIYSAQAYPSVFIRLFLSLLCIFLFAVLFVNSVTFFAILTDAKNTAHTQDDDKNIKHRKTVMRIYAIVYMILSVLCIPFVLAAVFIILFVVNPGLEEAYMGRYSSYPQEEVLKILKEEYRQDFTIVSVDDSEAWRIIYKIRCDDIPELTFKFEDQSDGIAGYFAFDDFPEQAFKYAAEKSGFEIGTKKHGITFVYKKSDGLEKTAKKLKNTVDLYFEIVNYCKGDLSSHPTYHEPSECLHFCLSEYKDFFVDELELSREPQSNRTSDSVILKGMSSNEIAEIIKKYVSL